MINSFYIYGCQTFQKFIDESHIYRPVLVAIKHEYEKALEFYSQNVNKVVSLHSEIAAINETFAVDKKTMADSHADRIKLLQSQRLVAQQALNATRKDHAKVAADYEKLETECLQLRKENEELQNSVSYLSVALTRSESERMEMITLKQSLDSDMFEMKNDMAKLQGKRSYVC